MDANKPSNSKSICSAPWTQVATSPLGTIRLCCTSSSEYNVALNDKDEPFRLPVDWDRALNSEAFRTVRSDMLAGRWPKACSPCKQFESRGVLSPREVFLKRHRESFHLETLSEISNTSNVVELDLRLGNLCNLKCRMCGPYSSSSWMQEYETLLAEDLIPEIPPRELARLQTNWQNESDVVDSLSELIPNLQYLYITGGEPTLSKGGELFLERCIQQRRSQNIHLRYNTNGTYLNENLIKMWSEFASVRLKISLDGVGALNEYIRYPSKWDEILLVLSRYEKLKEKINLSLSIQVSMQAYNAFNVKEMMHFFSERGIDLFFTFVERPTFLSLGVYPVAIAEIIKEKLVGISHSGVNDIIKSLNSRNEDQWDLFVKYTKRLDQLRGQRLLSAVPELAPFWSV